MTETHGRATAWRMLLIAFLAQNCAIGMTYGSYGALVPELQEQFVTTRSLSSSGLSALMFVLGLLSPFLGTLLGRISLRAVMIAGGVLNVLGYLALANAPNIYVVLAIYAFVLGPGVCMLGIIAPATLLGHWFSGHRAKALTFMSMPLFLALTPPIVAFVINHHSYEAAYYLLAATFALLLPLLFTIVDRPATPWGQEHPGAMEEAVAETAESAVKAPMTARAILLNPYFWCIHLGIGVTTGIAVILFSHLIPIAIGKNISLQSASIFFTGYGVAGIGGALVLGWLSDRIGPVTVLAADCAILALLWFVLRDSSDFAVLLGVTTLMGFCMTSIPGIHAASLALIFGPHNLAKTMGYGYSVKIPFMFGSAPLVGYLYDISGNYAFPLLASVISLGLAAMLFLYVRNSTRHQPTPLKA